MEEIYDGTYNNLNKIDIRYNYYDYIKNYMYIHFNKQIEENINNNDILENIKNNIKSKIYEIYDNKEDKNFIYLLNSIIDFNYKKLLELKLKVINLKNIVNNLQKLDLPEQRTKEWFDLRKNVLTASSLASALDECHFTSKNQLLLEKSQDEEKPYKSNPITEWGVKYEEIATKFYELINNVKVLEFGLIPHPDYKIFGASPDGICSNDSPDEFIGRMLEIKCPPKRKFTKSVPTHYGYQMQGQLECCNLEECDFLQVKIEEYENDEDYINDNYYYNGNIKEGYNSNNLPKGCTITYQKSNSLNYSYLYPNLCLSYNEYLKWIEENKKYIIEQGNTFIESKWWKIERYECTLVKRDRLWWNKNIEKIYNFWEEVKFYRNNDKTTLIDKINENKKNKRKSNEIVNNFDECLITL